MALSLVTPPAVEPVSLDEAKTHLRVDISEDDELIEGLIQAARENVEQVTRRALITQTWELYLDCWPPSGQIALPRPPLQSVVSVKYVDEEGNQGTVASGDYLVDVVNEPGHVVLKAGKSWPATRLQERNGVVVRFVAGYGDAAADVPRAIRQAILLIVGALYENREEVAVAMSSVIQVLPFGAQALLRSYRMVRF